MVRLKDINNYTKIKTFLLGFLGAFIAYFLFNGLFIYFFNKPSSQIFSELISIIFK